MSTEASSFLNIRFREERIRVGLSHSETGEACGYSRGSVIAWEKDTALPAQALELLAPHGFDVQYIVTGVRSSNADQAGSPKAQDPSLSAEEWKLVKIFRKLAERERPTAISLIQVIAAGGNPTGGAVATHGGRAAGRDYNEGIKPKR